MVKNRRAARRHGPDAGVTLVEILISIALLGISIGAVLTALTTTISATATERDHANAHAWLQSGADILYGYERLDCTVYRQSQIVAGYQAVLDSTQDPEGWHASGGSIEIIPPVLYWDGEVYQSVDCWDSRNINLQLITIEVTNPDGKIVESVQVVKG